MKILIDVRLLGRGGFSGIEEYTRNVVYGLLDRGAHHTYQLFYNGFRLAPPPSDWQRSNVSLINWHVPNKLLDLSSRFLREPAIDRFISTDCVFSPHFNIMPVKRVPHIVTFHDLSFLHHPDFFVPRQKFWHWLQAYRRTAESARHIIAVSEFTKSDLVEFLHIPEERISVVHSGINPALAPLPASDPGLLAFKKKHDLHFPFILFLGTLEPRKNITALIQAFSLLKQDPFFKDYRLIIAGGPGWRSKEMFRAAAESPFRDTIIFWGTVHAEEKIFLYNLTRLFVYPSFFEGFGFPPLEAQACGTPVVVSNRTSIPEIIGTSGVLTDPWRIHELASAVESVLKHDSRRAELIQAGYKNSARFTWQKTAASTLTILETYGSAHH